MVKETGSLIVTDFGEVELLNALESRIFRRELTATQIAAAQKAFKSDIAEGILALQPLPGVAFQKARQLVKQHTARLGTRTLDVLHVAAALVVGAEVFLTFDPRQTKLAEAAGLLCE